MYNSYYYYHILIWGMFWFKNNFTHNHKNNVTKTIKNTLKIK